MDCILTGDDDGFNRIVDEYIIWNADEDCSANSRSSYAQDIAYCLVDLRTDGFYLAKRLEDRVGLEADAALVAILDKIEPVKRRVVKKMISKWVVENQLKLPEDILGKRVNWKQDFTSGSGFVIHCYPESYRVLVGEKSPTRYGKAIDFENITIAHES
jgi:hypothetical protein